MASRMCNTHPETEKILFYILHMFVVSVPITECKICAWIMSACNVCVCVLCERLKCPYTRVLLGFKTCITHKLPERSCSETIRDLNGWQLIPIARVCCWEFLLMFICIDWPFPLVHNASELAHPSFWLFVSAKKFAPLLKDLQKLWISNDFQTTNAFMAQPSSMTNVQRFVISEN